MARIIYSLIATVLATVLFRFLFEDFIAGFLSAVVYCVVWDYFTVKANEKKETDGGKPQVFGPPNRRN